MTAWQALRVRLRQHGLWAEVRHVLRYGPALYRAGRLLGGSRLHCLRVVLLP